MIGLFAAHANDAVTGIFESVSKTEAGGVESTLPVLGTLKTAGLGLFSIILATGLFYFILTKIPVSKKFRLSKKKQSSLARLIVFLIFGALTTASWDIWWHRAVGRDSLFQEPHLFLYGCAISAIILSIVGYILTHEKTWKKVATVLILVPSTAPFDNLWHLMFGVEDLSEPISLAWSPPHALLALGGLLALFFLIPILSEGKENQRRNFFIEIAFGGILGTSFFLFYPFHPTDGWGQVLGFWGAGFITFIIFGILTYARKVLGEGFHSTRIIMYFLILFLVAYGKETAEGIILLPHDRQANWLIIIPYLASTVFFDFIENKLPTFAKAGIAGGIWAALLFFTTPYFSDPNFAYSSHLAFQATFAAVIGAAIGSIVFNKIKFKGK